MELSKFREVRPDDIKEAMNNYNGRIASVTVQTGMLWWVKTKSRTICRGRGGRWYFIDTGEFTHGNQAELLEARFIKDAE